MPIGGPPVPANQLTGGRVTRAVIDGTETVVLDDLWGGSRYYSEVAASTGVNGGGTSAKSYNVTHWTSGAWTGIPAPLSYIQEKDVPQSAYHLVPPSGSGVIDEMAAITAAALATQIFNAPVLPSGPTSIIPVSAGSSTSGGTYFQRVIPAGQSWLTGGGAVLSVPAAVTSLSGVLSAPPVQLPPDTPILPAPTAPTFPLVPMAMSAMQAPPDQAFNISFLVPGSKFRAPDVISTFFFGGTNGGVDPQYSLAIRGDGTAELWEYGSATNDPGYVWIPVFSFRYCRSDAVCDTAHFITIFPHVGPQGQKFIAFRSADNDTGQQHAGGNSASSFNFYPAAATYSEVLYQWDGSTGIIDGSPGHATGAGYWYLQERADIRHYWQVSKTIWCSGVLVDDSWALPVYGSNRTFAFSFIANIPTTAPIIASHIRDAETGDEVTMSGPVTTGLNAVYCTFGLTTSTDYFFPSILWGYTLTLPATDDVIAPGSFTPPVEQISVLGGEYDARREQAHTALDDPGYQYPRLANRGYFPVRLETDIPTPGGGAPTTVVLFRGYADRPHVTKKGKVGRKSGLGQQGAASVYPSQDWRHYELMMAGMWQRLTRVSTRTALTPQYFAFDYSAPQDPVTGAFQPWKVTDIVRYVMGRAGFPSSMLNIPDIDLRIQMGIGVNPNDFTIDPHTNLADFVMTLIRNYLGLFLVFDPNAGTVVLDRNENSAGAPIGQWTLIGAPPVGATPLLNFVTQVPQPESGFAVVSNPYALSGNVAGQWPTYAYCIGDLEPQIIRPDHNQIVVATIINSGSTGGVRLENAMCNPYSANFPGFTPQADPDGPHWIGHIAPLIVVDPTLWGGDGAMGLQNTQMAVDFTVRRLFQYTCLPRAINTLHTAFTPVVDPVTSVVRPLRFYDPVSFNNDGNPWYARNCNPAWTKSSTQMMTCQIERTIPMPS